MERQAIDKAVGDGARFLRVPSVGERRHLLAVHFELNDDPVADEAGTDH